MKLYHATICDHLPSIKLHGLAPGYPANYEGMQMLNKIYFALDPEAAIAYAETSDTYADEDIVVLSVDLNDLDDEQIEYDWNNKCEYETDINSIAYGKVVPYNLLTIETKESIAAVPEIKLSNFKGTELYERITQTFYECCETCMENVSDN